MPFVHSSSQPCGNIEMCGPCWEAAPEQQWAICTSVEEVLTTLPPSVHTINREEIQEILGNVCSRVTSLKPDPTMENGIEERLLVSSIEVLPRQIMLTEIELAE